MIFSVEPATQRGCSAIPLHFAVQPFSAPNFALACEIKTGLMYK